MKRVLIVSPHYPPDSAAGAHRARVLAPYLAGTGWRPTILTLEPSSYEGVLDEELAAMSHGDVEVLRATAVSPALTRHIGVGDLGLRAVRGIRAFARAELTRNRYDALYLTTYPVYPALIGPGLRDRYDVPFVLDLQDPWVGAWGDTVGGGTNGAPDLKSQITRAAHAAIERRVVRRADALTSVSSGLLQTLRDDYPELANRPSLELPIGIDPRDVEWARRASSGHTFFDPADGLVHWCYVGTVLPLAMPLLGGFLTAVKQLCVSDADAASRLRVHFIGTSNQSGGDPAPRVLPLAHEIGVTRVITEYPRRIPFAAALRCQLTASALLVLGSTEARYTASKIAAAVSSGRPLVVVAHERSDAVRQVRTVPDPAVRVVSFDESRPIETKVDDLAEVLRNWTRVLPQRTTGMESVRDLTGPVLAQRLARFLDSVTLS